MAWPLHILCTSSNVPGPLSSGLDDSAVDVMLCAGAALGVDAGIVSDCGAREGLRGVACAGAAPGVDAGIVSGGGARGGLGGAALCPLANALPIPVMNNQNYCQ